MPVEIVIPAWLIRAAVAVAIIWTGLMVAAAVAWLVSPDVLMTKDEASPGIRLLRIVLSLLVFVVLVFLWKRCY